LQQIAALAESSCKAGIASTKYGAAICFAKAAGIANAEELLLQRRPYEAPSHAAKRAIEEALAPLKDIELNLYDWLLSTAMPTSLSAAET
jgi:4-hydroxy-2-oxoglutarate aldolase